MLAAPSIWRSEIIPIALFCITVSYYPMAICKKGMSFEDVQLLILSAAILPVLDIAGFHNHNESVSKRESVSKPPVSS